MSQTLTAVRRKIRNTDDMRSVVKMMKAMATTALVQFRQTAAATLDYYHTVAMALSVCLRGISRSAWTRPQREGRPGAWLIFGTDQGMVGAFNEQLVEAVRQKLQIEETRLWVVGSRLLDRLENAGLEAARSFSSPQSVDAIGPLVGELLLHAEQDYLSGAVEVVGFCHHSPSTRGNYETIWGRLLPLDQAWLNRHIGLPWPTRAIPEMLETGTEALMALIREYLFVSLFRACAESCAAEQSARLASMHRAEQNIEERREALGLEYNRGRQGAIDAELFDLISGYEARAGGK